MNDDGSIIKQALSKLTDESLPELWVLYEQKLAANGISPHQANQVLGLDKKTVGPILDYSGKSADIFNLIKVAEFVGISDLTDLIILYFSRLPTEKVMELEKVRKTSFIINNFSLDILKKEGFIKGSINDFEEIEKRIVTFFDLKEIFDYNRESFFPLFSRTRRAAKNKMLDFWIKSAHYMFKKAANPYPYDRDLLKDLVAKIKPFSMDEENGFIKVIRALYKAGVTVVCQPHTSTTQIRGATFIVDNKPCIVLTTLNNRFPTLWFALMHELCHVLFDYEYIEKTNFHLSLDKGAADLFLDEKREEYANSFATDYFLTDSQLKYISPLINNGMMVKKYADSLNIHQSFIYAFYCWKRSESANWALYSKYFPSIKKTTNLINVCVMDYEKLVETSNFVKNIMEPQTV